MDEKEKSVLKNKRSIPKLFFAVNVVQFIEALVFVVIIIATLILSFRNPKFGLAEYALLLVPFSLGAAYLVVTIGVFRSASLAIACIPILGGLRILLNILNMVTGKFQLIVIIFILFDVLWIYLAVTWIRDQKKNSVIGIESN